MKYGLHGKLTAKFGQAETLANILLEAANLVGTAKGCHLYMISIDDTDSNSVWITECWDSKEVHDASLSISAVRELIAKAFPLIEGKPEKGQVLEILGGHGI